MKRSRSLLSTQALLVVGALILLWLAVRDVSWPDVVATLRQVDLTDLAVLIVVDLCVLLAITFRWWLLLGGFGHRLPFRRLIRYRTTVFGLSYITPGPQVGGEVLQVYYPVHYHNVPAPVALAVASVDKTLEFLVNFTFIAGGTFVVLIGKNLIAQLDAPVMLALTSLLLVPIFVVVSIARGRHPLSGFVTRLERLLPRNWRVRMRKTAVLSSLPSLHRSQSALFHTEELVAWLFRTHPWTLALSVFMAFVAFGLGFFEFWLMTRALQLPLTLAQTVAALVLVYFSFLLPVPAGLGAMEASLVLAFTSFGYSPAQAVSLGLLVRARDLSEAGIGLALGGIHMGASLVPHASDPELESTIHSPPAEHANSSALPTPPPNPDDPARAAQ